MIYINSELLNKIIDKVSNKLEGDWIIIGGTVLSVIGIDYRVTVDIDMIPFQGNSNESLNNLMQITLDLNLPVELINQAGGFFLGKIKNWQSKVVLIKKGKKSSVYRPNLELFFELKIARLSETDAQDCKEYLKWYLKNEAINKKNIVKIIKNETKNKPGAEKLKRLKELVSFVEASH